MTEAKLKHRRVTSIDPTTLKPTTLADFWLHPDGHVRVEWAPGAEAFRQDIEEHGIMVATGAYRPEDGADFFNNLDLAFSQSSFVDVYDVE